MKKNVLFTSILILVGITSLNAQSNRDSEARTVFGGTNGFGAFLGFSSKVSDINDQSSLMVGAELSTVLSSSFNFGFVGYGLVTGVDANSFNLNGELQQIHFGYGGLLLEPVIASKSMIHLTIPCIVGVGGLGTHNRIDGPISSEDFNSWEDFEKQQKAETDLVLIAEPGVNLEINLLKNVRLDFGVSYRYVYDSNIKNLKDDQLSGIAGNVGLRFGWF